MKEASVVAWLDGLLAKGHFGQAKDFRFKQCGVGEEYRC